MAYMPLDGELFVVGAIAVFLMWQLFAVRPLPVLDWSATMARSK
jgi:hypothetical protein